MSDSLFSPSWYRVADLKPRLRNHIRIHRHDYRGKIWFILQDIAAGRSHRLTPASYHFLGLMDGTRTVDELWQATGAQGGEDAPTQDEVIRLLGQLHAADALICDVPPDGQELFRRYQRHERQKWKKRLWTPLAVRIPLWDPESFLDKSQQLVDPIFSRVGALVWLAIVSTGIVLAGLHWDELTKNVVDRVLTPENLFVLWLVYPVVKAFHELGHAYAVKHYGGEVHEIGIMFLVLVPVPYVDASAAWGFRAKRQRMLVGAIGILTELFLGALAMIVWINVEPGPVHAVAYNVMLISGVSTILFNGNPLLRFDGYYVLADAIEIPNLGNRSNKYLGYLIQKYLFGVKDAESGAESTGERVWFFFYGIAAFLYRMFIMFTIILYIGGKFFIVGVLLAIWGITTQIMVPIGKNLSFLFTSPRIREQRGRALITSVVVLGLILTALFVVPAPSWTRAEGVVWPSDKSRVRAGVDGFVASYLSDENSRVSADQDIIRMEDPLLDARLDVLKSRLKELNAQLMAAQVNDRVQTAVIREEIAAVSGDLKRAREQSDELVIKSPRNGVLVVPQGQDLPGQFVRKGELVGYVLEPSERISARVVVSQDDIGLVRDKTRQVEVMAAQWGSDAFPVSSWRQVPGGTDQLPTAALGTTGGGEFAIDPTDNSGRTTLERVFEIEIDLPVETGSDFLGQRVYVRFDHGFEPIGLQLYRSLRQVFLRRFSV
jgi:putative peptide zinc metalloprotease protein